MGLGALRVEVREVEIIVTEPGTSRASAVFHMPISGHLPLRRGRLSRLLEPKLATNRAPPWIKLRLEVLMHLSRPKRSPKAVIG